MADYVAFLSYSSRDRWAGAKLHSALETYRLPAPLIGRETAHGLLKRKLGPIFRDRTDLAADPNLGAALRAELGRAAHLIVICTPHSAASRWVNAEIDTFRDLGRENAIIAVIADGRPERFDPQICPDGAFPPSLLAPGTPEPFAPDLRDPDRGGDGFDLALLKVLSALIEVPLAELTQRHVAAEKQRRRRVTVVAAAMLVLALGTSIGGTIAWRQSERANARLVDAIATAAEQVETAAHYRDRFGVSSAVLHDLYVSAAEDFGALLARSGSTPQLDLARLRLGLGLAAFSRRVSLDSDDMIGPQPHLLAAETALRGLDGPPPLAARLGLLPDVSEAEIAAGHSAYLQALSLWRLDQGRVSEAVDVATRAHHVAALDDRTRLAALCNLADVLHRAHDRSAAEKTFRSCAETAQALSERSGQLHDRLFAVSAIADHAKVLRPLDRVEESLARQAEAARLAAEVDLPPEDLAATATLYHARFLYGDALVAHGAGDPDPASEFEAALALATRASASDPARVDWQRREALALERLASLDLQRLCSIPSEPREEAFETARDRIDRAVDLTTGIAQRVPDDPTNQRDLSVMLQVQSELLTFGAAAAGAWPATSADALEASQRVVTLRETLVDAVPEDIGLRQNLAAARATRALVAARAGKAEANTLFQAAIESYASLSEERDLWQAERLMLAGFQAKFLAETGDREAALQLLAPAVDKARALAQRHGDNGPYHELAARLPAILDPPRLGDPPC